MICERESKTDFATHLEDRESIDCTILYWFINTFVGSINMLMLKLVNAKTAYDYSPNAIVVPMMHWCYII